MSCELHDMHVTSKEQLVQFVKRAFNVPRHTSHERSTFIVLCDTNVDTFTPQNIKATHTKSITAATDCHKLTLEVVIHPHTKEVSTLVLAKEDL